MSNPVVNVLIGNQNYGRYLDKAIESALNQTYPCNLTIVDSASTDNSADVIKSFLGKTLKYEYNPEECEDKRRLFFDYPYTVEVGFEGDKRITYIQLDKNEGPSNTRNAGIFETINDTNVYAILDADDQMYPNKVERLIEPMTHSPVIGVVYGDYDTINEETKNIIREYKQPFDNLALSRECIVHSGSLIRSEALAYVFDENGFYDRHMRVAEDYDLWIRISKKYMICHVPESLSLVLVHNQNATNSVRQKIWDSCLQRLREKNRR